MLFSFSIISGVLSQVSAQSESPLTIDVSDGEDATLECRFSPQLSKADSTLFWIRTNRKGHDNVAIGNTPYQTGYRYTFLNILSDYIFMRIKITISHCCCIYI